ncbi:hypothetical protein AAAB33_13610, partial [Lentilactobacillus buchneri]|uniref:hypothetical protein n=1 Tax=Lentilactobacillus buchneri TaxID=1581 RepID=UPI0030F0DE1C
VLCCCCGVLFFGFLGVGCVFGCVGDLVVLIGCWLDFICVCYLGVVVFCVCGVDVCVVVEGLGGFGLVLVVWCLVFVGLCG